MKINEKDHLVGATVMGARGQVVIPKEFRDKFELAEGGRLVVMQHGDGPILLLPEGQMREFVASMSKRVSEVLGQS